MAYAYGQPVQRAKRNIKGYIIGLGASVAILVGTAIPSMAASNNYCGSSANGCAQSGAETGSCAGHGSFGAFGQGTDWRGGASGDNTAYNNSGLCGNPSDNSAAATLGDTPNQ